MTLTSFSLELNIWLLLKLADAVQMTIKFCQAKFTAFILKLHKFTVVGLPFLCRMSDNNRRWKADDFSKCIQMLMF